MAIVMEYKDNLEVEHTLEAAEQFIARRLPNMPDRVFEEDGDCKELAEFNVVISKGSVSLVTFGKADAQIKKPSIQ